MIKEKKGKIAPQLDIFAKSFTYTVPANSDYEGLVSMAESGYAFLAVVGFAITGTDSTNANAFRIYKAGTSSLRFNIKNNSSSARSQELYVYGLYVKY